MKISKFLLAENPLQDNIEEFILHTRTPRFLLKVNQLEIDQVLVDPPLGHTVFFASADTGQAKFYELEVIQEYDGPHKKKDIELAGKWWKEYMKLEEGGTSASILSDFHPDTSSLKILKKGVDFLTIYKGVVKKHKTEQGVLEYINETFKTSFESLDGNICNAD